MYKGATKLYKYIRDGIWYFRVVYDPIYLESKANILKQYSGINDLLFMIPTKQGFLSRNRSRNIKKG